jgi:hypothetical protein
VTRRKRKPPRVKVACGTCQKNLPATAAALLQAAADALNACRAAGLDVRVRHGAIECDEGLIIGPLTTAGFVARTRLYEPFPAELPPGGIDD